jgi:hypothetical protein
MKNATHSYSTNAPQKISIFIGCVLFLFVHTLSAQAKFTVKLKFSVQEGGLENSLITITRDGNPYRIIDPSKGKYFIDLELGSDFVFTFTKLGHITKQVIINTVVPPGHEDQDFAKFIADVGLEVQPEDKVVTYSQPVGKIAYSNASGDFDFDKDYTQTATEAQKKDKENAPPKPKEPVPNPRPVPPVTTPPTVAPSNPIPVVVKQPEYKPEPPKPKPVVVEPVVEQKPIVKNKEEKIIQEDRRRITLVTVTVNEVSFLYKKEEYNWGGVYYYRDGKNITASSFDKETE